MFLWLYCRDRYTISSSEWCKLLCSPVKNIVGVLVYAYVLPLQYPIHHYPLGTPLGNCLKRKCVDGFDVASSVCCADQKLETNTARHSSILNPPPPYSSMYNVSISLRWKEGLSLFHGIQPLDIILTGIVSIAFSLVIFRLYIINTKIMLMFFYGVFLSWFRKESALPRLD